MRTMAFLFSLLLLTGNPHRIVSVAPNITEILFALGAGDQVVGVTANCRYPEAARAKPKIGEYMTPSVEAILALRPDEVFMLNYRPDVARKLQQSGIDVVQFEAENLAGIYHAIQVIAGKIGAPERGRALTQSIQDQLRRLTPAPAGRSARPKVLFIVGRTPGEVSDLFAAGAGSYLSELIALAGAENIFADARAPYPQVSLEEVIRRNPDIIIDMGDVMGDGGALTESRRQAVKQLWNKYPFLRAVRRDAVFPVSGDYFLTPGPRVVEAVREIRKIVGREAIP